MFNALDVRSNKIVTIYGITTSNDSFAQIKFLVRKVDKWVLENAMYFVPEN